MGGQHNFPKEVWSPAGGWWADPKNWKRNTGFALVGIGCTLAYTWGVSAELENRWQAPSRFIPSQLWSKNIPEKRKDALGGTQ